MNYTEFNEKVLRFYLLRSQTSFFTLSINSTELNTTISPQIIASFDILKSNWQALLDNDQSLPQYFGLIAAQCYAASLMVNDEEKDVSDDAYIYWLKHVLGFNGNIQSLFIGTNKEIKDQEKIWCQAKEYLNDKYGLQLQIPEPKSYSRRYVQYPLSQLLLKTEDLKIFSAFFAEHFYPGENVYFPDFQRKLKNWDHEKLTSRVKKLFEDEEKLKYAAAQLFNHFQNWDGQILVDLSSRKTIPKKTSRNNFSEKTKIILIDPLCSPYFYKNNTRIDPETVFQQDSYQFHTGIMLFNPIPDYDADYEQSRCLLLNIATYILVDKREKSKEFYYLEKAAKHSHEFTKNIYLFQYTFPKYSKNHPLHHYFNPTNPLLLTGGIRLNNYNTFLFGFGPNIKYEQPIKVLLNGRPIEYSPKQATPGTYTIKIEDYRDQSFQIEDVSYPANTIPALSKGWSMTTMSCIDVPDIEGYQLKPHETKQSHAIRVWINDILERKSKKPIKPNLQIPKSHGRN